MCLYSLGRERGTNSRSAGKFEFEFKFCKFSTRILKQEIIFVRSKKGEDFCSPPAPQDLVRSLACQDDSNMAKDSPHSTQESASPKSSSSNDTVGPIKSYEREQDREDRHHPFRRPRTPGVKGRGRTFHVSSTRQEDYNNGLFIPSSIFYHTP